MPLHQLPVAPVDVSGAGLGLALNAPAPLPLATYRLRHPDGGALVLGVLGASHVVTVEHADTRFSEQVSCHLGGELPGHTLKGAQRSGGDGGAGGIGNSCALWPNGVCPS